MSAAIDWSMLEAQYMSDEQYRQDIRKMLTMVKDDAFRAGQHFVQNYPDSMIRIKNLDVTQKSGPSEVSSDSEQQQQHSLVSAAANATGGSSRLVQSLTSNPLPNLLAGFHMSKKNLVLGSSNNKRKAQDEVIQFMRGIMDECTHLKNFSIPVDTELIIAIAALEDGYVPRDDCTHLQDIWPGATIRFLKGGHVSSFVLYLDTFRKAVVEGFEMYKKRYPIL